MVRTKAAVTSSAFNWGGPSITDALIKVKWFHRKYWDKPWIEATHLKQSENESCLSDICDVTAVTPPPPLHPPFKVMDATHHCTLWRDDHWVQRYNNGIADRESRSHGLPWLHHLSCTCGLNPRYIGDSRNGGSGSAGTRPACTPRQQGPHCAELKGLRLVQNASMRAAHTFGNLAPFFPSQ